MNYIDESLKFFGLKVKKEDLTTELVKKAYRQYHLSKHPDKQFVQQGEQDNVSQNADYSKEDASRHKDNLLNYINYPYKGIIFEYKPQVNRSNSSSRTHNNSSSRTHSNSSSRTHSNSSSRTHSRSNSNNNSSRCQSPKDINLNYLYTLEQLACREAIEFEYERQIRCTFSPKERQNLPPCEMCKKLDYLEQDTILSDCCYEHLIKIHREKHNTCNPIGLKREKSTIRFQIPINCYDLQTVGKGNQNLTGQYSHLSIKFVEIQHPIFFRMPEYTEDCQRSNLYCLKNVNINDILNGFSFNLKTVYGKIIRLTVTKDQLLHQVDDKVDDKIFFVALNQGLEMNNAIGCKFGHLFVCLNVVVTTNPLIDKDYEEWKNCDYQEEIFLLRIHYPYDEI